MQLDKHTDYALRILIALAAHSPDKLSIAQIAQMYGISANHLSKVATRLVQGAFLMSERGRAGGLTLSRAANQINVGNVVRMLKADTAVVECLAEGGTCCIVPACGLRDPLLQAQEAFFAVLDRYSVADIARNRSGLVALLPT
ncbi:MAG: RrF2 family transcriptional regulator [Planktomarina sp.]